MAKIDVLLQVRDRFSRAFDKLNQKMKRGRAGFRVFARRASGALAVVGGSFVKALADLNKFDKGMARIEALASGGKLDAGLRNMANEISTKFGLPIEETMEGIYQAISRGVQRDDMAKFMSTAARAARVDGSSIVESVEGLRSIMNSYNMDVGEAENVAKNMFQTAQSGATTFGQIGSNISAVASSAAEMGISFQEILGAIAAITSKGDSTSEAITQIRSAIFSTNKELGDGVWKTMSMVEAFEAMKQKAGGSAQELEKLTGRKEAMNGILKLTGDNMGKVVETMNMFTEDTNPLNDALSGTTGEAMKMDTAMQQLARLFRDIGGWLNTHLAPGIQFMVKSLEDARWGFDKLFVDISSRGYLWDEFRLKILDIAEAFVKLQQKVGGFNWAFKKATDLQLEDIRAQKEGIKQKRELRLANEIASDKHLKEIKAQKDAEAKAAEEKKRLEREAQVAESQARAAAAAAESKRQDDLKKIREQAAKDKEKAEKQAERDRKKAADDAKRAEEKRIEDIKKKHENALRDRIKAAQDAQQAADPLAGAAGFASRFQDFMERRKQKAEGLKESEKVHDRLRKIAEKEARGIKISREDRKFRDAMHDFNVEQQRIADAKAEELKLARELNRLLENNLIAQN